MKTHELWQQIEARVGANFRYGQALFDILHAEGILPETVVGSLDDPYHRIVNRVSAKTWVAKFLTLDENGDIQWMS